ncbi:MAG TPA: hypothetical protein VMR86_16315 [Myxococcota bacterium]|nr:hypothetical protein [Myxococcota bacterium]
MWFSVAMAARETAAELGRRSQSRYATADGGWTEWRFEAISTVCTVDTPGLDSRASGAEVFWRFLRESEALSLLTPFGDSA